MTKGQFVEQKLMPSSSFRRDKIHQCWSHFVLILKSDLVVFIDTKKGMCDLELYFLPIPIPYRYECQPSVNFNKIL